MIRMGTFAGYVGSSLAVVVALLAVYTAGFGSLSPDFHRPLSVFMCGAILLLTRHSLAAKLKSTGAGQRALFWTIDLTLLTALAYACWRYLPIKNEIEENFGSASSYDTAIAFIGIAVMIEIGRRVWGLPITMVVGLFLAYLLFGHLLPHSFAHLPYSYPRIAETLWYSYGGAFSTILGTVINLVFVYIVFGTLLEVTGAGAALLKIVFAMTARFRGGPAYAAIVASGLFGTMSGSTVANVVGTGTFTIPMMLRRGFKPAFAAGIEATASSGGQIMPPIMGAAAFVMADLIGVPYLTLITAALVPAGLYYFNLFLSVAVEARKLGITPIPVDECPKLTRKDFYRSIMFLIPLLAVVLVLISGRSPSMAGFIAVITVVATGAFNPELQRQPIQILHGLIKAGTNAASVLIAIALIGIIIATMNQTGTGLKFAMYIEYLGQGQLFLSLVLAMSGALLLGMGMPTLPAYLVIILIIGPAIERMGLSMLTIHMFVFYYGVASSITPPVALAAYTAAPIAGADPLKTGIMAVRLGAAKFLVPFLFAYNPTLLLIEVFDPVQFVLVMVRAMLAFFLFATAMAGFQRTRLGLFEILIRATAGVLLILSWEIAQLAGLGLAAVAIFKHIRANPNEGTVRAKSVEAGRASN